MLKNCEFRNEGLRRASWRLFMVSATTVLALMLQPSARATLVGGWTASQGGGTLTAGPSGSFSYSGATTGPAAYATLGGGAGYTLGIGDAINFSGSITNTASAWANLNIRFGLFNSAAPAMSTGWSGYWVGNVTSTTVALAPYERDPLNGNWWSATGTSQLGNGAAFASGSDITTASTLMALGTYSFSLTYVRTNATTLQINWSLVKTADAAGAATSGAYMFSGSSTDSSVSSFTYNQVGVLLNGAAYTGAISLNNLDVAAVPEPSVLWSGLLGLCALIIYSRMRKISCRI